MIGNLIFFIVITSKLIKEKQSSFKYNLSSNSKNLFLVKKNRLSENMILLIFFIATNLKNKISEKQDLQ